MVVAVYSSPADVSLVERILFRIEEALVLFGCMFLTCTNS